jgi:hypothetical protein
MGFLPIPGEMYINDFPDKASYTVLRNNTVMGNFEGLTNKDEDGNHVAFLYGADIQIGDILTADYVKPIQVKSTEIDTYEGNPAIIKAYY